MVKRMSKINGQISIGNIITIAVLIFGGIATWFGIVSDVQANEMNSSENKSSITVLEERTDDLDVIKLKIELNAQALSRIERRLEQGE